MPSIIVHGGAGAWSLADGAEAEAGVARAAAAGWKILSTGGSALDAVEAAVRVLEDDPQFNAGYGAVLDRRGHTATDAAIAVAVSRAEAPRVGAVGAVPPPYTRHPIGLARRLLEHGEHAFIVGEGAASYAVVEGIAPDPPGSILDPAQHRSRRAHSGDTVGACAVDAAGHLASGTSTGGTAEKRHGRVGDSPLFGAGLWVEAGVGALSATGHGESILRVLLCRDAGARLAQGHAPLDAARAAVNQLVARTGGEGGLILVDAAGVVAHFTSTRAMPWAAVTDAGTQHGFLQ